MPATVCLNDIVDALEMQFDESSAFLDRDTGHVETALASLEVYVFFRGRDRKAAQTSSNRDFLGFARS